MGVNKNSGIFAAAFAAFCWGSATVMSKAVLDEVSPVALLFVQLAASVVVVWAFVYLIRRKVPEARPAMRLFLLGLLEPGGAYLLGLIGLATVRAGDATLIQATEAIMIVIISAAFLKDRPSAGFVLLSCIALVGLSMALGFFDVRSETSSPMGIGLVFVATATAAVYVVLSSQAIGDHDPVAAVGLQQLSALALATCALPFEALASGGGIVLPTTASAWAIAIISGVVQYAIAFSAYMFALSRISANLAGSFLNLTPVFGLGIAYLVLDERLSLLQALGAVVTIVAVTLLQLRRPADEDDATGKVIPPAVL